MFEPKDAELSMRCMYPTSARPVKAQYHKGMMEYHMGKSINANYLFNSGGTVFNLFPVLVHDIAAQWHNFRYNSLREKTSNPILPKKKPKSSHLKLVGRS